jgi:hypothetical protein
MNKFLNFSFICLQISIILIKLKIMEILEFDIEFFFQNMSSLILKLIYMILFYLSFQLAIE